MSPKKEERIEEIPPELLPEEKEESLLKEKTFAQRLENSVVITLIIGLIGLAYLISYFGKRGFGGLNLDSLNISFLILGIILHKTPIAYVRAINEAIKGCAGIILQFPFYAGIMAMMKESGLVSITANFFVQISNSTTYPFLSFLSAGLINLFVPSGGGQWAVQGPIMVKAAPQLGVSFSRTLMSVAYGDQVTNMLQPFWTLPLLALTRLEARHIMGYAAVAFIVGFIVMALGITFLPG